ncbi:MAG: sigma factor-like helix-turn-helix DNA-binding protein [Bdellovibrionota bacterium]
MGKLETHKPWLNDNGELKSDEQIKRECQSWKPSDWDNYLSELESPQREVTFSKESSLEGFSAEECAGLIFSMASEEKFPFMKIAVKASLNNLTPKQRNIVHSYYWEGKTVVEIAQFMKISKQAVSKTLKAALHKLKLDLMNGLLKKRIQAAKEILAS